MKLVRRLARLHPVLAFWSLAGASTLVVHDATFLAQLGPGEPLARALRGGGHAYWEAASLVLAAVVVLVGLGTALHLADLRRRARTLTPAPTRPIVTPMRRRTALRLWMRLVAVVAIGFSLQENVEHLLQHGHVIGLGALHGPEYPLALPVLSLVTLVAALLGAVVLGVERDLIATIAVLVRRAIRAPRLALRPPLELLVSHRSPLAHRAAGRAPPTGFVSAAIA